MFELRATEWLEYLTPANTTKTGARLAKARWGLEYRTDGGEWLPVPRVRLPNVDKSGGEDGSD